MMRLSVAVAMKERYGPLGVALAPAHLARRPRLSLSYVKYHDE